MPIQEETLQLVLMALGDAMLGGAMARALGLPRETRAAARGGRVDGRRRAEGSGSARTRPRGKAGRRTSLRRAGRASAESL